MAVDKKNKKALDAEITDALLDDFDKFEHFAMNYWKQIAAAAVLIVIGVASWVMISDARKSAEKRTNDEICNAKTEAEIIKVVNKYPGHPAANYARLRLAKMYLVEKKYDKAYEQFQLLRSSSIPREMTWRIDLDEAYSLELEGKKEAAAVKFAEIGADPSVPEQLCSEANYSAGRIYAELKQNDKARDYLQKAGRVIPGAPSQMSGLWQPQAKFMLIRLTEKPVEKAAPPKTPEKKTPAKK
jgi:tetratricopeptide (TPR) repeat protein